MFDSVIQGDRSCAAWHWAAPYMAWRPEQGGAAVARAWRCR
ncbi:hypothetical protein BSIN_4908 [Burkholderia singularis]|uniref:Uncharacterized protein n=1 Tax=Burkholderia singularis TaxID=1503053 RepID=A0A238HAH8_9BURK|nr:hypothetical protein BSIN_4908 [Burkholderia singularis]